MRAFLSAACVPERVRWPSDSGAGWRFGGNRRCALQRAGNAGLGRVFLADRSSLFLFEGGNHERQSILRTKDKADLAVAISCERLYAHVLRHRIHMTVVYSLGISVY